MKFIKKVAPAKEKLSASPKGQQTDNRPKDDRPGCVPISGD